jgi:two-component system, OmpR family, sensor histidine kinase KdpD
MDKLTYKHKITDGFKTLIILILSTLLSYFFLHITNSMIIISMSYILGVILVSKFTAGYLWGIISSFAGLFGVNYFVSHSYFYLAFTRNGYFTFLGMLIISLIVSATTAHLKSYALKALERAENTRKLNDINTKLLSLNGVENIANLALFYMMEFTQNPVIFYEHSPQRGDSGIIKSMQEDATKIFHSRHEVFLAHWAFENKCISGNGSTFGKNSSCTYFPLISHNEIWGVIGVYVLNQNMISDSTLEYINLILSQVAIALERQHLSDSSQEIMVEREKEKTRANLLRAVSHDLRTPLTGMIGASESLLSNKNELSDKEQTKLLQYIYEDSNWLLHMVENLLSVTRIREGGTTVKKTPEPLEEVITEAVWRLRKRVSGTHISVHIPPELILIPMDATLIEQVIINLLENAIKYAGKDNPITLTVKKKTTYVLFEFSDNGPGIMPERISNIFDDISWTQNKATDTSKGFGIGLSICKTIINAHGGNITVKNKPDKGAVFTFTLPLHD